MQGEFFTTESIESVSDSVVREFIQNSLDAGVGDAPVHVRFWLDEIDRESGEIEPFMAGLWQHLGAVDPGAAAMKDSNCRFLVIEDGNTTGLRGDPGVMFEPQSSVNGIPNEYFYFIRAEGRSSKSSAERGNWGVGKYTYPMASRINTFFALTCREDPSQPGGAGPLLLGQAILTHHDLDGIHYKPDGWWSRVELTDNGDQEPLPLGPSDALTSAFVSTFNLTRTDQPGLSVVIPFVDPEMTGEALVASVLKNFGVAIQLGSLEVEVATPAENVHLSSSNLGEVAADGEKASDVEVREELELATWWWNEGRETAFVLEEPAISGQTSWDDRVTAEHASALSSALAAGEPVAVRLPIHVRTKAPDDPEPTDEWARAEVIMRPREGHGRRPSFYREGIRVSEVSCRSTPGVQCMVIVEERPLARMLGAAEGPAHVDWQAGTRRFKGRFANGRNLLGFVKQAPSNLLRRIRSENEEDVDLAATYFCLPPDPGSERRGDRSAERTTEPPPTPPPPTPPGLLISGYDGGFRIAAGPSLNNGDRVDVHLGYDVRRGNPVTRWEPADFELEDLSVLAAGAEVSVQEGNQLVFTVVDTDSLDVRAEGFDVSRDVFVKAAVVTS